MSLPTHHGLAASLFVCTLFVCAPAPAQIGATDTVIANTRGKSGSGVKLVSQNLSTCSVVRTVNRSTFSSFNLNGIYNGGAAYDAVRGGVWYSNGWSLSCVDPVSGAVICHSVQLPVIPRTKLSPFSITVGGLAFDNRDNTLYLADGINGDLYQIKLGSATDPRACVFKSKFASVRAHMPSFHWLGGLAIDQVNRQLFVGSSHMTNGTRHIYVTDLSSWSGKWKDVTGKAPLCPTGTAQAKWMQGLAFDSGRSLLHVTSGSTTSVYNYTRASAQVSPLGCCANPSRRVEDTFVGLALLPELATTTGKPCALPPCPTCAGVKLRTLGDAALGNPHFALRMSGAPSRGTAFAAIGVGSCSSPGLNLGLCAPITLSTRAFTLFGVVLDSAPRCGSTATLSIPIPASAAVFGFAASSQFLMQCSSGHVLTNCLSFEVTRN